MTWWSALFASAVVILFVGGSITAVLTFRPQRARAVKHGELEAESAVQQHITELAGIHPEIHKQPRLDRHPYYIAPHIGAFAYACCLLAGAPITSNVTSMSPVMRHTMAVCFIIGATLVLVGASMGARIGPWVIAPRVRRHALAPLLGDDISLPYWIGCAGAFTVAVSMAIYSSTSFQSTVGSLGGWITGLLAAAAAPFVPILFVSVQKFERNEATLRAELQKRMDRTADVPG